MKKFILMTAAAAFALCGTTIAYAQDTLTIWWLKPDYASEEDYLNEFAKGFGEKNGMQVDISFFSSGDIATKTRAALGAGEPPDLAFSGNFDSTLSPKLASEDELVELTDVIAGRESEFYEPALRGATFLNATTGKKALYGFPIGQVLRTFNYWKSLLEEAGYTEADIPKEWDAFWNFWCDDVQGKLQEKGMRINGVGQGMSATSGASDVYQPFFLELEAYGVKWINEDTGELDLDNPAVRDGFIKAYEHFTSLYTRGCVPESVTTWSNEDNNTYFHNKSSVITSVASLSIVNRYIDEGDDEIYFNETRTIGYPNAPDGKPVGNVSQTRSIVVFKRGKNVEGAKKFIAAFSQPEAMEKYNEASNGQVIPSMIATSELPFWTDPKDPHKFATYQNYKTALESDRIIRFPNHFNAKLSTANGENVWGRAMGRIIVDKVSVADAVDELFARLKEVTK